MLAIAEPDASDREEKPECEIPELSFVENVIKTLASYIFFMSNFDAMAIYKEDKLLAAATTTKTVAGDQTARVRRRYKLYLRPELKLELDNNDKWRQRLKVIFTFFYVIVLIRFSGISLVTWTKYHATTFSSAGAAYQTPVMRETPLIKLLRACYLYDTFGNVMSDFPGGSVTVYTTVLIALSYSVYYLPRYYSRVPANAVDLRMAEDPCRERRRLDLLIRKNLKDLIVAMDRYCAMNGLENPLKLEFVTSKKLQQLQRTALLAHQPPNKLHNISMTDFLEAELLRPWQYSSGYARYWRVVRNSFPIVVPSSILFAVMLQLNMTRRTSELRCRLKHIGDRCTLLDAFTLVEIYSLLEMIFAMYWVGLILCTSILTIVAHLDAQMRSLDELESDMEDLLDTLRQINLKRLGYFHWAHASSHSTPPLCRLVGPASFSQGALPRVNMVLLRSLAKARLQLTDIRDRAQFISEQVSSLVVLFTAGIVLALTAVKMEGPDIEALRLDTTYGLWLAANLTMIICAHEHAKVVRLERVGWPIVAQLNAMLPPDEHNIGPHLVETQLDPLTSGWRKLLEQDCLVDVRNSIRPFGLSLTFKQILEMNFYVTSLAALVLR